MSTRSQQCLYLITKTPFLALILLNYFLVVLFLKNYNNIDALFAGFASIESAQGLLLPLEWIVYLYCHYLLLSIHNMDCAYRP